MPEFVYLIRNGDLFCIGRTEDLERIQKAYKPGLIEIALESNDSKEILKILQKNYSERRLPGSNYYRLSKSEFIQCKKILEKGENIDNFKPFFSGIRLIVTFIAAWISLTLLIIKLGIQPIFNQFS